MKADNNQYKYPDSDRIRANRNQFPSRLTEQAINAMCRNLNRSILSEICDDDTFKKTMKALRYNHLARRLKFYQTNKSL